MTGRSLFTVAAASELRPQAEAEIKNGAWEIVGSMPAFDRGPERKVALSPDCSQFALLTEVLGTWSIHSGPWTYATMERCAEHVAAGDARAITWPDAQLCLAVGYLALLCEGERRRKQQEVTQDVPAGSLAAARPTGETPPMVMPSAAPSSEHCRIAGCGE